MICPPFIRIGSLLVLLLGQSFAWSNEPPRKSPASIEPVTIPEGVSSWEALATLYRLSTGAKLIVAPDQQTRVLTIGAGTYSPDEFALAVDALADASGAEVHAVTDTLHVVRMKRYGEPQGSTLPRVPSPAPDVLQAQETGKAATPSGPVVVIEAEIGALSLGRRYESGVDLLAALDDFEASNVGGGLAAGSGISRGLRGLTLGASSRPLSRYIKLLDSDTDYTSVARPRLQVMSGQAAKIATGQRVAVPTQTLTSFQGGPQTASNIQYQDVQLALEITPEVQDSGSIVLRIVQSDDSISGSQVIAGNTVPTISSQTFSTVTSVRPLQTIALGGIRSERTTKTAKGPRGLAKVPLLGRLFRVDGSESQKSELVIFVTCWLAE